MFFFGENIKRIRLAKNMSQAELGDMLGVHAIQINRYETNNSQLSIDMTMHIAEALVVSVDELIYGSNHEKAKNTIDERELLHLFTKVQTLSEQDIFCIKSLLNAFIVKTDFQRPLVKE